jgi:DNA-binding response OmpR family regulator
MRILVVEDDPIISQLIETILEQQKYAVDFATDGQMGLDLSEAYEYDAILLDVSLPKKDGISVCRQIRSQGNTVPILLLTALDSPADRARGLDAGADDYLGKPFDPQELLARIRAILRRSHQPSTPILTWGNLQLDPLSATVTYSDKLVPVTPKEYALLELLLRNNKRVFSCDAILNHLWSYGGTPSEEAIRTHVKGLRHKLKQAGAATDLIETVYGIGYRLKPINSLTVNLLNDTWEKFKDQVLEQVAGLERLSVRFLNRDLQSGWQEVGRSIAHSLSGSLGMFGFSLSSELARQIEKLLGSGEDLTIEQGQWLYSMVGALQSELERPVALPDLYYFDPNPAIDILLVSVDPDLERDIQSLVDEQKWHIEVVPTIAAAKSQLRSHPIRSILLAPDLAQQTEEVVRLLVDVGKHVPVIPVILLTDAPELPPEIDSRTVRIGVMPLGTTSAFAETLCERFGTCTSICPNHPSDIIRAIERSIAQVESTLTHILIVDDDLKILAILRAILVPWGFRVTTLSDPQKFWEVVPVVKPDLLILDVEMPLINGLELCQSVRDRADWAHLPIIFLTARTESSLIQQVFAIGADDFVNKPVVGPEIIARITNLMERQQVKKLRAAERLKVTSDRAKFSNQNEIQLEPIAIGQLLQAENERHTKTIAEICDRLDLFRQLLNDNS